MKRHLTTTTKDWPQEWLSYFLLGNHYLNLSDRADSWFSKGYKYAADKPEYLNNYGYALVQEGCISEAKKLSPNDQNLLSTKIEFDLIPVPSETALQDHCASYTL